MSSTPMKHGRNDGESALLATEAAAQLRERFDALAAGSPGLRRRQMAQRLDVSELELVVAGCAGVEAVVLKFPPQDIFKSLGSLGRVMALTRNEYCVHERHGRYEDIRAGKTMGLVLGPDIDLRLFFTHWKTTLAVNEGGRRSLQFFDRAGTALHKVYLTGDSDAYAYAALVNDYAELHPERPVIEPIEPPTAPSSTQVGEAFRTEWLAMQDTHEFHGLLQRHDIARLDALRGIGADLAQQVPEGFAERLLVDVAEQSIPFMCFVGNHGVIQIHSGPVGIVRRTGPWFNVLEPHFNLHLNTTAIASAWVVNKPSKDGWITSMECFSPEGDLIVQFFGARKPGIPELTEWRRLLVSYCEQPLAA